MSDHLHPARDCRGQATTELILMSWIIIAFIASAVQLFLVDRAVFKSLTAAHATHFREAFERFNCADRDNPDCEYDGGAIRSRVEWDPAFIPSIEIPIIGMFRPVLGRVFIESNNRFNDYSDAPINPCPTHPTLCKRTKMAAGTYEPLCRTLFETATVGNVPPPVERFCRTFDGSMRNLRRLLDRLPF